MPLKYSNDALPESSVCAESFPVLYADLITTEVYMLISVNLSGCSSLKTTFPSSTSRWLWACCLSGTGAPSLFTPHILGLNYTQRAAHGDING